MTGPVFPRDWRDVLCVAVAFLVLVPSVAAAPGGLLVSAMAAVAVAAALMRWPSGRVGLATASSVVAVVSLVVDLVYFGPRAASVLWMPVEFGALLILTERIIRRVPGRRVIWVAALVALAAVVLPLRFTLHLNAPQSPVLASIAATWMSLFLVGCVAAIGLYLRALDHRRITAVAEARREQRLALAGDLHDFVAHEVTGIVLEAQAGQLEDDGPEPTRALLGRIEAAGLRALDSMDQTVQALRGPDRGQDRGPDSGPEQARVYGLSDLPDLVGRFSATGAIHTEVAIEPGLTGTLPREIEATTYRLVLEALTNIRRHAPRATRIEVIVAAVNGPAMQVSITDDGAAASRGARPRRAPRPRGVGGTGLPSLEERVVALGGTFAAGPAGPGWRVTGILPTAKDSHPPVSVRDEQPQVAEHPSAVARNEHAPAGARNANPQLGEHAPVGE